MNANSKLSYSGEFGNKDWTLLHKGEGCFENTRALFVVVTPQLEITVLGTNSGLKFIVNSKKIYKEREKGIIPEPIQKVTYYTDSEQMLITNENDIESVKDKVVIIEGLSIRIITY